MPRLLLSLLCPLFLSSLTAQGTGDHQFQFQLENTMGEWVEAPDGSWYGAGWSVSYPGYPMGLPFVIKWDAQHDSVLWITQVPMPLSEVVWDVALLPAADGGVYLGAAFDGCDYSTRDGLAKLSANGTVLWIKQTPNNFTWSSEIWLIPYPDGHLLYHTDHYQIEYDENGIVKWTDHVNFDWNGIAPRLNGGYLVYGDKKVATTNLLLSMIPYPFPENIVHARQLPSGNWLFLSAGQIYRVAPNYSILAQKPLPNVKPWSKIFQADSTYWVSGENAAQEFELRQIDTVALDVLSTHNSGNNYRVKSLLHLPGDSVLWLSGDGNFDRNQTVFLKSEPFSKPVITPNHSVALTDIRLEITPEVYWKDCYNWDLAASYEIHFGSVYVTVKNTGSEPVQSFRVNGNFTACNFICPRFEQISVPLHSPLAPGDSVELLLMDNFDLDGQLNSSTFHLCFWTSLPDERLDAKPEDNKWCETFSVLVSEQEPVLSETRVQLAPNPAGDYSIFSIAAATPGAEYSLTLRTISGQLVFQDAFSGSEYPLNRKLLPAGIYFYTISEQGSLVGEGKLVFVD